MHGYASAMIYFPWNLEAGADRGPRVDNWARGNCVREDGSQEARAVHSVIGNPARESKRHEIIQ